MNALVRCALAALVLVAAAPLAARAHFAEIVLRDGKIVTLDPGVGTAEAIAIGDGRILDVGTSEEVEEHLGPGTRVIDLAGRLVVPGFIDGHAHFISLGESKMTLDLMGVKSWDEVVAMVAEAASSADPGEWIVGRGWHQEKWDKAPAASVEGFPTHDDLSDATPDNPVLLTHASGHACLANKLAMDLAEISGATHDPPGGEILRDRAGRPTGLFRETAQTLISRVMEETGGIATPERRRRAIELAARECLAKGVTSVQDAGCSFDEVDALADFADRGALGVRLWVMIREPNDALEARLGEYASIKRRADGFLTVGGIKRTIDGALGSRGAWLLEPYADSPQSTGLATATVEEVAETAKIALAHGLQLGVHAIGDRANREVLDLYERLFRAHDGATDLRWRIEHAQHLHPSDIPRFGALGVIASMQGIHCTSDAPWVIARLGAERARSGAYVWRSLRDSGAIVSNGTDAPVEDVDPIACYHATVSRRLADGSVFHDEQRLSRMEALRSYTIDAAYAAFEEDVKGTLTPGKYADLVVLTKDILTVPEEEILQTRVAMVIVAGEIAYEPPAPGAGATPGGATAPQAAAKPPPLYDEAADAGATIAAALGRSAKENRRVLIQWGANWCGWCKLLHEHFEKEPQVKRKLMYEYDVVRVDVGRFDRHLDLAAKYGAALKEKGLPYLTVLAADGRVIANQETGSLERDGGDAPGHDAGKVLAFLTEHQAPPLRAEEVLARGLEQAKRDGTSVFLHFGAPWCGWCHRLEDWMAQDDVRTILARDYLDVKIDTDRMTGAQEVFQRLGGGSGGIPWYAILAPDGTVRATSTLFGGGNIGFPYEPHEIGAFIEMLGRTRTRLTDGDLVRLSQSLRTAREEIERRRSQ
jgi:hypothetical protein